MQKTLLSFVIFILSPIFAAAELPVVTMDTYVHTIAQTISRTLWSKLKTSQVSKLTFDSVESDAFKSYFTSTVTDLHELIHRIETDKPILQSYAIPNVGEQFSLVLSDASLIVEQKHQLWDKFTLPQLKLGLQKMGTLGKHESSYDWDNEVKVHANEVLVRVWYEVNQAPEMLTYFLMQLAEAAPTCIQGHTVRLIDVMTLKGL